MSPRPPTGARGATLVEYALAVALVAVVVLGAIQALESATGDEVEARGQRIGDPSSLAATTSSSTTSTTTDDGTAPPPSGPGTVTIGSATGTATVESTTPYRWKAEVSMTVVDSGGQPVTGMTITGTWTPAAPGGSTATTVSCTTDSGGTCEVVRWDLKEQDAEATFTVTSVAGTGATYAAGAVVGTTVTKPA